MRAFAIVAILALLGGGAQILLSGCQSGWIIEQGWSQLALLCRREPIDDPELLARLGEEKARKLAWVEAVLEHARDELGLDPGDAYSTVIDTGGNPVTTTVLAAHPEALAFHLWCFPLVGCVPYKGFFDGDDARAEAFRLREKGYDVAVLPVEAYSSLGWFSDPIVSTLLDRPLPQLVNTLIHEIVHRTLFYPGKTTLNESLATFIAREGTLSFFARHPEAATDEEILAFRSGLVGDAADTVLLERTRRDLDALYRSERPSDELRRRKREIFRTAANARARIFGPAVPFPASNAFILSFADYHSLVPKLEELQERIGGTPRDLMSYLLQVRAETGGPPAELITTP